MNETNFKRYTKNGLKNRCKFQHIESPYTGSGIPDSIYSAPIRVRGFIEFKFQRSFPKRIDTVLKIINFTKEQKLFLRIHGDIAGFCFFFIRIEDTFLIFDHRNAQKIGNLTQRGMRRFALKVWEKRINFQELEKVLKTDYKRISND